MTCQCADALIEDVLNGEADREGEEGLRQHLSQCGHCAEAWHVAWQVRQALQRCEAPDPGESYFEQATAAIMARIRSIDPDATVAEDSPAVTSARYGPLQIRGVGLALLITLGLLTQALRPCPLYSAVQGTAREGDETLGALALETAAALPASPFAASRAVGVGSPHPLPLRPHRHDALHRLPLLERIAQPLIPCPSAFPLVT